MNELHKYIALIFIGLLCSSYSVFSQTKQPEIDKKERLKQLEKEELPARRTVRMPTESQVDSLKAVILQRDTAAIAKSPSGIDSLVTFFAEDTVVFNLKSKKMYLKGKANIDFKFQKLNSEIIEIDFANSVLHASYGIDSASKKFGFPKFDDQGEIFFGEDIKYNFKTKRGNIIAGETQTGEGFYFGSKIKRQSESELYVQDGYYTTCDDACPHYYFGSPKMKLAVKDKIFLDPIIFYVEDMPIFIFPFGLFFPNKSGRQSGVIIPSFYFSRNRGVVFQDFGFYWAASDYWDTQLKFDFFSKGGFLAKNMSRWALRDVFKGSYNVQYGKTRFNPDDKYLQNWSLQLNHNHSISPQERIDVNVNFASQDFNRNTQTDYQARIQQNMTSNASYSRSFDNGSNFSTSFQRDQNLIDKSFSQTVPINYSLPNFTPFKKMIASTDRSWYAFARDISFSYRSNYTYSGRKYSIGDSAFKYDERNKISHSPSISISPKFGFFTLSPSISFSANNYFRQLERSFNPNDSAATDSFRKGFFTEYYYSFGLSLSTRVFGVADNARPFFGVITPEMIGFKAFRHTYQPSISYTFTPDFSQEKFGFFGKYYDAKQKREIKYSRYERDGGAAPSGLSQSISYSDLHSFEIKVKQADSLPDKNIELLRLTFAASYNLAADSMKLSDISMSFRSPSIGLFEFSGNATFTAYDEQKYEASSNNFAYRRVNQFLIENGKGIARLTNISFSLSTSFSSMGQAAPSSFSTPTDSTRQDSLARSLGDRFLKRQDGDDSYMDWYGDSSPGYTPINVPWVINAGMNFNYDRFFVNDINRSLNAYATLNMKLTETWNINANLRYDFIKNELLTPQINLTKNLHCWQLILNWTPTGYNRGFYLKFGINSSTLQDLKIEKRSSPIFR